MEYEQSAAFIATKQLLANYLRWKENHAVGYIVKTEGLMDTEWKLVT